MPALFPGIRRRLRLRLTPFVILSNAKDLFRRSLSELKQK